MNVKNIVNDFLIDACPMHKMRRLALVEYINSIINGNSLTVTSMGRGIEKLRRHLRITQSHIVIQADIYSLLTIFTVGFVNRYFFIL